jgi:lipopolysaccharide heptosyltransferase II
MQSTNSANTGALGALARIGPLKRRIIRLIEAIARPVISVVDRLKPSKDRPQEVRKILVMEYWNLGDVVMQTPFLINLRNQYPNAHIVLLTSPKVLPLIDHQNLVDETIELRVPWAQHYSRWRKYNPFSPLWLSLHRSLRLLRQRRFDLAFTVRADLRDNFILWFINARRRVGYAFGGGGFFLTDMVEPDLRNPHFSNRWLRLLQHLGKPIRERQPRLNVSEEELQVAKILLEARGFNSGDFLVGVHPGARSVNRQWGEANFAEVAQRLVEQFPVKIIWFQEPGQHAPPPTGNKVVPLSLPLREFMAVLSQCSVFLCNDSGPMHIATALNVPVVTVFGPTEPAWFGPLGPQDQIVIRPGFWCRPCFDYCLFDQPYCLRTISVQDVYQTAHKMLDLLLTSSSGSKVGMMKTAPSIQSTILVKT